MRRLRNSRLRWWHGGVLAVLAAIGTGAVLFFGGDQPAKEPRPGPPGVGPLTLVTLGDSTLSGEGTGVYEPGTNGERGNWCHRSPLSAVHTTSVPGIEETINLACSGAPSAHLQLRGHRQYGEQSQAKRLGELTQNHRIAAVAIAIGANDDPHFSRHVTKCAKAWFGGQPCSAAIAPGWRAAVDNMVPKVVAAIQDVRSVLERRGYKRSDYQLVLLSYAAPIAPGIPENLRSLAGCPFQNADLRWVKDEGIPVLNDGMRRAAGETGVRFLDMSRSGEGHEACTGGDDPSSEWFSRLTVRFDDLEDIQRAGHAATESFHPNIAGHAQVGRCVTEFLRSTRAASSCVVGTDGNLHAR